MRFNFITIIILTCQINFSSCQDPVVIRDLVALSLKTENFTFQSCCFNEEESRNTVRAIREGFIRATTAALLTILSPAVDPRVLNVYNLSNLPLPDKVLLTSNLLSIVKSINFSNKSTLSFLQASILLIIQNHLNDNPNKQNLDKLWIKVSAFTAINTHVQKVILDQLFFGLKTTDGRSFIDILTKSINSSSSKCGNDEFLKWIQNKDDVFYRYVKDILQTLTYFLNDITVQLGNMDTFTIVKVVASVQLNQNVDIVLFPDFTATIDDKVEIVDTLLHGVPLIQAKDGLCYEKVSHYIRNKACCTPTTEYTSATTRTITTTTMIQSTSTEASRTISIPQTTETTGEYIAITGIRH